MKHSSIMVNNKEIGLGNPTYVIAEPGINHFGKIDVAKKLIRIASKCGSDAIKFQTIFPEEVYSKNKDPSLYEKLKKSQFTKKQWIELKEYAMNMKIDFFSTPAGVKSAKLLNDIDVSCFKIGSGELNKKNLIDYIANQQKPTIISTGMSTISEITKLVEIFKNKKIPLALLHVNSSYPTPYEDANLSTIPFFKKLFADIPIGYSDHTVGSLACTTAAALGANIIEKHFVIEKSAWAIEEQLSANPDELASMIKVIRLIEKSLGTPRTGVANSELKSKKTMRYSIAASKYIRSGTKLTKNMLTVLRPGTGIDPKYLDNLIGLTAKKSIEEGNLLSWDVFKD